MQFEKTNKGIEKLHRPVPASILSEGLLHFLLSLSQ